MANAYNLAGGKMKTFLDAIIPLNNNLKNLWIFKFQPKKKKKKIHKFYNIKKNIYVMYATYKYYLNMKQWRNNIIQRNLMIDEICINEFQLVL